VAKKLYVENLSYETTGSDLRNVFEPGGTVQSALVIMDREASRSQGFGFPSDHHGRPLDLREDHL
jgi:cold-inducible RNA-binding protein